MCTSETAPFSLYQIKYVGGWEQGNLLQIFHGKFDAYIVTLYTYHFIATCIVQWIVSVLSVWKHYQLAMYS